MSVLALQIAPEAELIREIEGLIRKMANGEAKPNDIELLHDLQQRRVNLMRPRTSRVARNVNAKPHFADQI